MDHPSELEWIDGDLPDVHSVPKWCSVLVWFVTDCGEEEREAFEGEREHNGKLRRISACSPYENDLNPLRWCDSSCHPIGYHEKVAHWSWINKGTPEENTS